MSEALADIARSIPQAEGLRGMRTPYVRRTGKYFRHILLTADRSPERPALLQFHYGSLALSRKPLKKTRQPLYWL